MTHAHRWALPTPTPGVTALPGVCRECGAEKDFPAFLDVDDGNWLAKYARTKRRIKPHVGKGGDR